jgi:hypothetical protein
MSSKWAQYSVTYIFTMKSFIIIISFLWIFVFVSCKRFELHSFNWSNQFGTVGTVMKLFIKSGKFSFHCCFSVSGIIWAICCYYVVFCNKMGALFAVLWPLKKIINFGLLHNTVTKYHAKSVSFQEYEVS